MTRAKRDHAVEAEITAIRIKAGPTETAVDDPLVRNTVAIPARRGVSLAGWPHGGCDLVHFHDVGAVGIVLGPGALDVAHQADEPKDCLARAALIYRDIAVAMMRP